MLVGVILLVKAYMRHSEAQKYKLLQIQQEANQKHEIDNMKLRFFTNISHDLRTPLTLIRERLVKRISGIGVLYARFIGSNMLTPLTPPNTIFPDAARQ